MVCAENKAVRSKPESRNLFFMSVSVILRHLQFEIVEGAGWESGFVQQKFVMGSGRKKEEATAEDRCS